MSWWNFIGVYHVITIPTWRLFHGDLDYLVTTFCNQGRFSGSMLVYSLSNLQGGLPPHFPFQVLEQTAPATALLPSTKWPGCSTKVKPVLLVFPKPGFALDNEIILLPSLHNSGTSGTTWWRIFSPPKETISEPISRSAHLTPLYRFLRFCQHHPSNHSKSPSAML